MPDYETNCYSTKPVVDSVHFGHRPVGGEIHRRYCAAPAAERGLDTRSVQSNTAVQTLQYPGKLFRWCRPSEVEALREIRAELARAINILRTLHSLDKEARVSISRSMCQGFEPHASRLVSIELPEQVAVNLDDVRL